MNLKFLAFLLSWLGILFKSANGTDNFTTYHYQEQSTLTTILPRHPHQTHWPQTDLTITSDEFWQICGPDWDTDDRLVCHRRGYHDLLTLRSERQGWSVYCPLQTKWAIPTLKDGRCYATPRDSTCARLGYHYTGHVCEFPQDLLPQQDALSNQSSDDSDIDAEGFAYLAIAIFLCAFLFPCVLGVCCFYWGEDAESHHDQEQEHLENGETHLPHVTSVSGMDSSNTVIQDIESMPPPSYDSCNNTIEVEDEGV